MDAPGEIEIDLLPHELPPGLIRNLFSAIDGCRFEELDRYFTPDVVYERPGYEPIEGLDALDHFYRNVRIVADGNHRFTSLVIEDDTAACWGRFVGQAQDGRALNERFADVYQLRDGKICKRTTYFFRAAM